MPHNKRSVKRKTYKKLNNFVLNIAIGTLAILVIGFLTSSIKRIFFNSGFESNYSDLSTLITKTTYEKQTGHKIQIEIWNGCGIKNLALMYTDFLRSEGLDVMDAKNADHFNYINTTIFHHRGEIDRAETLANILALDPNRIIEKKDNNLFHDLTLIIGKDYKELISYRNAVLFQPPF